MSTTRHPAAPLAGGVSAARRLHRVSSRRDEGQFLVEGPQALREAVDAGVLLGVFATEGAADTYADLLRGVSVTVVGDRALASLAETVTPQGLVGVARTVALPVAELALASATLVAVLIDVRDPGNAGAVIRVADAAGADAVVFADGPDGGSVDPHGGKCVRASAGSVFHLPIGLGSVEETLSALRTAGLQLLAADGTSPVAIDLDDADADAIVGAPSAWIFGNEAHGVPAEVLAAVDRVVRVPIRGRAESLNLATAAAVCLYAGARQQRHRRKDGP
jgi:TrmH family RNA methyltransferase